MVVVGALTEGLTLRSSCKQKWQTCIPSCQPVARTCTRWPSPWTTLTRPVRHMVEAAWWLIFACVCVCVCVFASSGKASGDRYKELRKDCAGVILYAAERATECALDAIQCLGKSSEWMLWSV